MYYFWQFFFYFKIELTCIIHKARIWNADDTDNADFRRSNKKIKIRENPCHQRYPRSIMNNAG